MRLLPEWVPQEAIILAWPDAHTDWQPWLADVQGVYLQLIGAINAGNCGVILLIRQPALAAFNALIAQSSLPITKVLMVPADYNDTWVRDYAFLCCQTEQGLQPVEFNFNGWGNKFDASKDNQINRQALAQLCNLPLLCFDLVAEGGALEIDQRGHLLSTEFCLANPKRNGDYSLDAYRKFFARSLGATSMSIFANGHLQGDDTDGHIDTLVRFTPDQGLVIQTAFNRPDDQHFCGLQALVKECRNALPEHVIFELPLPWVVNSEGERLPASYANYLINNQQVLCPVYLQPEDQLALEIIAKAYPQHKIIGVNCLPLIQQYGSLHCISMQVPSNTLQADIMHKLSTGVSVL